MKGKKAKKKNQNKKPTTDRNVFEEQLADKYCIRSRSERVKITLIL